VDDESTTTSRARHLYLCLCLSLSLSLSGAYLSNSTWRTRLAMTLDDEMQRRYHSGNYQPRCNSRAKFLFFILFSYFTFICLRPVTDFSTSREPYFSTWANNKLDNRLLGQGSLLKLARQHFDVTKALDR
jgi:hypothetical protein